MLSHEDYLSPASLLPRAEQPAAHLGQGRCGRVMAGLSECTLLLPLDTAPWPRWKDADWPLLTWEHSNITGADICAILIVIISNTIDQLGRAWLWAQPLQTWVLKSHTAHRHEVGSIWRHQINLQVFPVHPFYSHGKLFTFLFYCVYIWTIKEKSNQCWK